MAIPSHDPANVNGITMVARRLTTLSGKFIDGTNAITRISPADSFCKTGNRSASVLLKTIAVNQNTVKGKVVLLLDDVSSTGTSISTVSSMIIAAGATSVIPLVCATTAI